jgi:hypothetical protein
MKAEQTAGPSPGRLRVFPNNRPVLELWLTEQRLYQIGRQADCDLCIDDPSISRQHLLIDTRQEPWLAEDPGSKNGTRLDGRLLGRESLGPACWFSLAGIPARFERLDGHQLAHSEQRKQQLEQTASLLLDRLQADHDLGHRLDQLLQGFLALSGCSRGALLLRLDETDWRTVRLRGWDRFQGSASVVKRTLEQAQVTAIHDLAAAPPSSSQESMIAKALQSVVCLPLRVEGEVRGVLYGDSERPGKVFTELDVELMQAMADQAMLLIGVESLRKAIRAMA